MQYAVTAKYIRMSPRKVRLVADRIRSLPAGKALAVLSALPKRAAKPLLDVIGSAVANAKNKGADIEKLKVGVVDVMGGPAMKRWRAVSRGMPHSYKKRMTHIRIVLTSEEKT